MDGRELEALLLDAFGSGAATGAHMASVILGAPDAAIPAVVDRVDRSLRASGPAVRELVWELSVGIDSDAGQGREIPIAEPDPVWDMLT